MKSSIVPIALTLVIILYALYIISNKPNKSNRSNRSFEEGWQDYQLCPFGEVKSGSVPIYFYSYNRYRRPYRWPFRYYSSYPWPHLEPGR